MNDEKLKEDIKKIRDKAAKSSLPKRVFLKGFAIVAVALDKALTRLL